MTTPPDDFLETLPSFQVNSKPGTFDELQEAWHTLYGYTLDEELENQRAFEVMAQFSCPLGPTTEACIRCGTHEGVQMEPSRTAYSWDGRGKDPNENVPFCRDCAEEHHAYWDEMWNDYYSSRL